MEIMLPGFILSDLTAEEESKYRERWEVKENRFALLAVPRGLPIKWRTFGSLESIWCSVRVVFTKFLITKLAPLLGQRI